MDQLKLIGQSLLEVPTKFGMPLLMEIEKQIESQKSEDGNSKASIG